MWCSYSKGIYFFSHFLHFHVEYTQKIAKYQKQTGNSDRKKYFLLTFVSDTILYYKVSIGYYLTNSSIWVDFFYKIKGSCDKILVNYWQFKSDCIVLASKFSHKNLTTEKMKYFFYYWKILKRKCLNTIKSEFFWI